MKAFKSIKTLLNSRSSIYYYKKFITDFQEKNGHFSSYFSYWKTMAFFLVGLSRYTNVLWRATVYFVVQTWNKNVNFSLIFNKDIFHINIIIVQISHPTVFNIPFYECLQIFSSETHHRIQYAVIMYFTITRVIICFAEVFGLS